MPFLKKIFGNKVSTVSTSKINGVVPYGNENGTENSGSIAVRKPTISTRNRSPTSPPNTITRRKMTLKEIIKEQEKQGDKMDYEMMRRDGFKSVSTDVESASVVSTELGKKDKKFDGFGWITGVLIRCILCIFGATLFLRMSWIAGQSGILLGLCVIILSCVVVILTAISMSAIATNGEIKNG
uniref:Amino acid permease/ SLC12A domain-containing protein n=1 Tax=Panagrolaimus sp. JU765 TaxID=591449 RepID=A0AC34R286_9BILA